MIDLDDQSLAPCLVPVIHLADVADPAAWDPDGGQLAEQLVRVVAGERLVDGGAHHGGVSYPLVVASALGDAVVQIALIFAILHIEGTASDIGAAIAVKTVGLVVFLLAGGV
jgi:hypothetical protein